MKRAGRSFTLRAFSIALALLVPATAGAQTNVGQIAGRVTDPSSSVLPGATVTAKSEQTSLVLTRTLGSVQQTLSNSLLNSISVSATRNEIRAGPQNQALARSALGLTYPEIYPSNRFGTGPDVVLSGFTGYNAGDYIKNRNAFNTVSFTDLNTTVKFDGAGNPSGGFGQVTKAAPGRVLEFGVRMTF